MTTAVDHPMALGDLFIRVRPGVVVSWAEAADGVVLGYDANAALLGVVVCGPVGIVRAPIVRA